MDEFKNSELKVKRINNIPQIYLNEEKLNDNKIRIIVETRIKKLIIK